MWPWHSRVKRNKLKEKEVEARILALLLFTFVFGTFSGCAGWFGRPDMPLPEATAEQLTGLLKERETAVQTMKGLFRVQIQGPGIPIAQRVEGALFYRRPDVLRLQGFTKLGGELFQFLMGADQYILRLPTGQVVSGRTDELERVGKVGQPFKLSVLAMSGVVGVPAVSQRERVVMALDGDRYRLDVFGGVGDNDTPSRRIWFDPRSLQVVQEDRLLPSGELEATVQFDDYRVVSQPAETGVQTAGGTSGTLLLKPFRITAQDGRGRGVIMLTFHEMVPNVALKPEELRLTTRPISPNHARPTVMTERYDAVGH